MTWARLRSGLGAPGLPTVLAVFVLFLALFHETVARYLEDWLDLNSNYGHGLLVVAMSLYILWSERQGLVRVRVRPALAGVLSVFLLSLIWGGAHLVHVEVAEQMAVAALIPALVWALFGKAVLRRTLFPLLFIWMAVPVWEYLMPMLQELSARASFFGLQWLGVPVLREGNQITIPSGRFEIAEYCAGLRYLLAALSIGVFFAWQRIDHWRRRVSFLLLVVCVALVANWLRVIIVIMAGYLTEMQSPLVQDHATMGWLLFAAVLLPVFWFGGERRPVQGTSCSYPTTVRGTGTAGENPPFGTRSLTFTALVVSALAVGPAIVRLSVSPVSGHDERRPLVLPDRIGDWQQVDRQGSTWRPTFHGASSQVQVWYRGAKGIVGIHLAYYARQGQGREAVFVLNRPYDRKRWHIGGGEHPVVDLPARALDVQEYRLLSENGQQRLIWWWYDIAGRPTASRFEAKLLELEGLLAGRGGAAVVALTAEDATWTSGRRVLAGFLEEAYPVIRHQIDTRQDDES